MQTQITECGDENAIVYSDQSQYAAETMNIYYVHGG